MTMHFRPKIHNGQVAKRQPPADRGRPRSAKTVMPSLLTSIAPIWTGMSLGAWATTGLSVFGLEGKLRTPLAQPVVATAPRARIFLGLLACGLCIAGGFIFSLRDHFIAHAFGKNEVQLKSQLDQTVAERRALAAHLGQAMNPQEVGRAARQLTDLQPIRLEQKKAASAIRSVTTTEKAQRKSHSIKEGAAVLTER